jgi:hypothetical protein
MEVKDNNNGILLSEGDSEPNIGSVKGQNE